MNAVFVAAPDGVAAAVAMQRALWAKDWGEGGVLCVRMALHTDPAERRRAIEMAHATMDHRRLKGSGTFVDESEELLTTIV